MIEQPVHPAAQPGPRAGPAQLGQVQGLHETLSSIQADERLVPAGRVRAGSGGGGALVLAGPDADRGDAADSGGGGEALVVADPYADRVAAGAGVGVAAADGEGAAAAVAD